MWRLQPLPHTVLYYTAIWLCLCAYKTRRKAMFSTPTFHVSGNIWGLHHWRQPLGWIKKNCKHFESPHLSLDSSGFLYRPCTQPSSFQRQEKDLVYKLGVMDELMMQIHQPRPNLLDVVVEKAAAKVEPPSGLFKISFATDCTFSSKHPLILSNPKLYNVQSTTNLRVMQVLSSWFFLLYLLLKYVLQPAKENVHNDYV